MQYKAGGRCTGGLETSCVVHLPASSLPFLPLQFSCCGGDEYRDWEVNLYHSCNGSGPLACGVPYTCCIRKVKQPRHRKCLYLSKIPSSHWFLHWLLINVAILSSALGQCQHKTPKKLEQVYTSCTVFWWALLL